MDGLQGGQKGEHPSRVWRGLGGREVQERGEAAVRTDSIGSGLDVGVTERDEGCQPPCRSFCAPARLWVQTA